MIKLSQKVIILIGTLLITSIGLYLLHTIFANKARTNRAIQNTEYLIHSIEYWKTRDGNHVATIHQQNYTIKELKRSTNAEIAKLKKNNEKLDITLRKTQYLLSISGGLNIDTIVKPFYDTIEKNIYLEIDTLTIESLKIKRVKRIDLNTAYYHVEYKPELTCNINWYKEGNWTLRNIIFWRPKIYKIDVMSNDTILKPTSVILLKVGRK